MGPTGDPIFHIKMTALHWSAYNGAAENVRLLLKAVRMNCRCGHAVYHVCVRAQTLWLQTVMARRPSTGQQIILMTVPLQSFWYELYPCSWLVAISLILWLLKELAPAAINLRDNEGRTSK